MGPLRAGGGGRGGGGSRRGRPRSSPLPTTTSPTDASPALDLSDRRHVRALYFDLLGRAPTADELAVAQGARPETFLRFNCGSHEFWTNWYEQQLFYFLLIANDRPGDEADGPELIDRLARGDVHVLDALRALVSGPTFHRANPGNDTFVSVVFEQLLAMTVQDEPAPLRAGKRMYDGDEVSLFGMRGSSQADVVRIVMQQPEVAEVLVAREYRRVIGVEPSREQVRADAATLLADPDEYADLVCGWLLSPEYADRLQTLRLKSDVQYLRGLWIDVTGAEPEPAVLQRQRDALLSIADAGPLRAVVARTVVDGPSADLPAPGELDDELLVEDLFARFLGRDPSAEELSEFVFLLRQTDVTVATLTRALVTHWEYQYY